MGTLQSIALDQIRDNPVALRSVNHEGEAYLGLVESMKSRGFIGAISVRERKDEATGEAYYELIDGLHRTSAARDAGLTEINVDIQTLDDAEMLEVQIMSNFHKIETKPVEYSKQLRRILMLNPMMTESELAVKLGNSPAWIQARLGLNKIDNETISGLINEGKIGLSNAYALAKLPEEEMADFTDRAMTLAPDQFIPQVETRVKEIRDAARKGKKAAPAEFVPTAFMQKLAAMKDEQTDGAVGSDLIKRFGITDPQEVWAMAINWALHLDPVSVEMKQAEWNARKAEREAANQRRKDERAAKKAAEAAEKASEAGEEAA